MVQPGNDTCNIRTLLAQSCFNTVGILQHSVIVVSGSVGMYQLCTVCICISARYMYTDMYHVRLLAHMYCSFVIVVAILSPFTLLM